MGNVIKTESIGKFQTSKSIDFFKRLIAHIQDGDTHCELFLFPSSPCWLMELWVRVVFFILPIFQCVSQSSQLFVLCVSDVILFKSIKMLNNTHPWAIPLETSFQQTLWAWPFNHF